MKRDLFVEVRYLVLGKDFLFLVIVLNPSWGRWHGHD